METDGTKLCYFCYEYKKAEEFAEDSPRVCMVCRKKGKQKITFFDRKKKQSRFSSMIEGPIVRKPAVMGEILWNEMFKFDVDWGGWMIELTGMPRSGKTSMMGKMAKKVITEQPECRVFWQEPQGLAIQAQKIQCPWMILYPNHQKLHLYNVTTGTEISDRDAEKEYGVLVRGFNSVKHCWQIARKGHINVIYFGEDHLSRWIDLVEYAESIECFRFWKAFFFDEMDRIVPQWAKGKQWFLNERYARILTNSMKAYTYTIYNTQSVISIDPRVRAKLMASIYLPGARVDNLSIVRQYAVQNLDQGQAYLDVGKGKFGLINFRPLYPVENPLAVRLDPPIKKKKKSKKDSDDEEE